MTITVDVTQGCDRLDRILSQNLKDLSRSRIQQLIEQNCVSVNGEPCLSKKLKVQAGDRLTIEIPPAEPLDIQPLEMPLDILYEDDHLLIVNKPAGLVVHPAPGHYNDTLVNALLAHCGDRLSGIGGIQRPGIVHRLDKDTTGAIVIAKSDRAHQHLQAQIQAKNRPSRVSRTSLWLPQSALRNHRPSHCPSSHRSQKKWRSFPKPTVAALP